MRVTIKELAPDDWEMWRHLRLEALRDAPAAFAATFEEWSGVSEDRWRRRLIEVPFNLVAALDGRPAGIASGCAPDDRGRVELISMYVAPFARGKAVGEALIAGVIDWARTQNASAVVLGVREWNERASALYTRCGFVETNDVSIHGGCERRMIYELAR